MMKHYWQSPSVVVVCLLLSAGQLFYTPQTKTYPPIALAIGEDVSGSFQQNYSITPEHVRDLCKTIAECGRGGIIRVVLK